MNAFAKPLALLLLFLGEFFAVYAEMVAERLPAFKTASALSMLQIGTCMTIGAFALLIGYYLGYKAFQNIWIVTVVSVTSILIVEPALAYFFFQELPNRGATIGLILGSLGLIATITL